MSDEETNSKLNNPSTKNPPSREHRGSGLGMGRGRGRQMRGVVENPKILKERCAS